MFKIKNLVKIAGLCVLCAVFPVHAENLDANHGNSIPIPKDTIVEYDLENGTRTEIVYEVDENATKTSGSGADILPYFLEPIDSAEYYPFSAIGMLIVTFEGGTICESTGFVVANDLVLTAAHCVQEFSEGYGNAKSIYFYAGYDYDGSYVGSSKASAYYVSPGWTEKMNEEYDWALLKLSTPIGNSTGILSCKITDSIIGKSIMTSGYADGFDYDDGGASQGVSEGEVVEDNGVFIRTSSEGEKGCSGCPILDIENWDMTVVGVASDSDVWGHICGPKITRSMITLINGRL